MRVTFGTGPLTIRQLADFCNAKAICYRVPETPLYGLCTDSLEADRQTAFLTLAGRRDDGEAHIEEAVARGCPCVICRSCPEFPVNAILTHEREAALMNFAKRILKMVNPRCVAVTGSAGKTTTKELIASVLSQKYKTFKTSGNHNSLVGMPLSLLELKPDAEWAVLEMGMNAPGEIRQLSQLATPEIAMITNIGTAHIGLLGSQNAILKAKCEIFSGLQKNGVYFINVDDEMLFPDAGNNFRRISLSAKGRKADFSAKNIRVEPDRTIFDLDWEDQTEKDIWIPALGQHSVYAALFAFATGIYADISPDLIRVGLRKAMIGKLRQTRTLIGGVTLIEDCYNASPESTLAALDLLDDLCKKTDGRGITVLGDMLELGAYGTALHRKVGAAVAGKKPARLFTIGPGGNEIAEGAIQAGFDRNLIFLNPDPTDLHALTGALKEELRKGDIVLIKASRKIAAERVGSTLKSFLKESEGGNHE